MAFPCGDNDVVVAVTVGYALKEKRRVLFFESAKLAQQLKSLKRCFVLRKGEPYADIETMNVEEREEAQKESEAELSDLIVCFGQEQNEVEKLTIRLKDLGEDVESLLEGVGDDAGLPEDED
ncbi:hypothetical protein NE237_008809 [Protea cynaroides]|uniref:Uso1/p115-like vesicle tethering protein C-terminal domain-containing protein n=1 Tax=Protea cynaroides TaxID=273540 RepID=A0A9Q0R016_9MAGN|nr:hypothetical protein NE237_008809 [Protea cynaroides]